MKIVIPENQSEITLGTYQKYVEIVKTDGITNGDFKDEVFCLLSGLDVEDIGQVMQGDKDEVIEGFLKAIGQEAPHKMKFKMGGNEFGMIPNLDKNKISGDEYTDFVRYDAENVSTLHNLMAILYRPIKTQDRQGNYLIVGYEGTSEYAEVMKEMPLSIVNGAIGFFLTLLNELNNSFQESLREEQTKEARR